MKGDTMTKKDLEKGTYVLEDRVGCMSVFVDGNMQDETIVFRSILEDLSCQCNLTKHDIVKVYQLIPVWERKEHTIIIDGEEIAISEESFQNLKKSLTID
jgi:hypothetical protein